MPQILIIILFQISQPQNALFPSSTHYAQVFITFSTFVIKIFSKSLAVNSSGKLLVFSCCCSLCTDCFIRVNDCPIRVFRS